MILCVDIGNTSIKLARVGRGGVGRVRAVPVTAVESMVARAVATAGIGRVEQVAIASVRPASTAVVRSVIRRELGIAPLLITHRSRLPLAVGTRRPASVGIDRLCAASAAIERGRGSAIVIDVGTAITVDLVLDRRFRGGLIMAGPQTALAALHLATARLPGLRFGAAGGRFDDTVPAMQTGAVVGAAGSIEAAVRLLRTAAGRSVPVWLTGGDAPALRGHLPSRWRHDPHLTLRGIAVIARLNPGQGRPY